MEETFTTKDWNIASVLLTVGIPLLSSRRVGNICWFVFKEKERCEALTESFWRGDLTVNAKKFCDSQRWVKDLIHRVDDVKIEP